MRERRGRPRKRRAKARSAGTENLNAVERVGRKPDHPLVGVALLKIALELKKTRAATLDDVVSRVLASMGPHDGAVREYLASGDLGRRLEKLKRR
jgi:hypothetical protein